MKKNYNINYCLKKIFLSFEIDNTFYKDCYSLNAIWTMKLL